MPVMEETYYSDLESLGPAGRPSYHALSRCPVGRRIPDELRIPGPGMGRDMCPACEARLNAIAIPYLPPEPFLPPLGSGSSRRSPRPHLEPPYAAIGTGLRKRTLAERAASG